MWARRAKDDIFVSGSGTWGQMARGGVAIRGGAKSEQEAAASEKKRAYGSRRAPGELSLEGRV